VIRPIARLLESRLRNRRIIIDVICRPLNIHLR